MDRMGSIQTVDAVVRLFIFLYQLIKSLEAALRSGIYFTGDNLSHFVDKFKPVEELGDPLIE